MTPIDQELEALKEEHIKGMCVAPEEHGSFRDAMDAAFALGRRRQGEEWPKVRDKMHKACSNSCGEDPCCLAKQSEIVRKALDSVAPGEGEKV